LRAQGLAAAGGLPDLAEFGTGLAGLPKLLAAEGRDVEQARLALRASYEPMRERISIAMALAEREDPNAAGLPLDAAQVARIVAALRAVERAMPAAFALIEQLQQVGGQGDYVQEHAEDEAVLRRFSSAVDALRAPMNQVREQLQATPLPFSTEDEPRLDTLVPSFSKRTDDGEIIEAASATCAGIGRTYFRCMAHLCVLTLRAEEAIMR
jgi:hypothetical protein